MCKGKREREREMSVLTAAVIVALFLVALVGGLLATQRLHIFHAVGAVMLELAVGSLQ